MTFTNNYKEDRKKLIHPWEKPMRFINVIILFVALFATTGALAWFADIIGGRGLVGLLSLFALTFYGLGSTVAKTKANAIKITEKQFEEVHNIIVEYSEKLELGYIPDAYVVQENGAINAFASSFFARRYISINSDIFEVSYLEHKDIDTLKLIIAHELTHLKRKHATTLMTFVETPARLVPLWSSAQSRVKEYTCDRHAAWLCPEGVDGLMLLSAGKHLYKNVDPEEYLESTATSYKGLFCFLHNLTASHPVMPKRFKAIKNLDKPGRVF